MIDNEALEKWFCREVLPLERMLTGFIRNHCHNKTDVIDLRQEIYERILKGAMRELPTHVTGYCFEVARNHLRRRAQQAKVVSFEVLANFGNSPAMADLLTPHRHASGREEMRKVRAALEALPRRRREVVALRKWQGLSAREVADALGVGIDYVNHETAKGIQALSEVLLSCDAPLDPDEIAQLIRESRQ